MFFHIGTHTREGLLQTAQLVPLVVMVVSIVVIFGLVALFGWIERRRK